MWQLEEWQLEECQILWLPNEVSTWIYPIQDFSLPRTKWWLSVLHAAVRKSMRFAFLCQDRLAGCLLTSDKVGLNSEILQKNLQLHPTQPNSSAYLICSLNFVQILQFYSKNAENMKIMNKNMHCASFWHGKSKLRMMWVTGDRSWLEERT